MDYKDKYLKYKEKYVMTQKGGSSMNENPTPFEILLQLFNKIGKIRDSLTIILKFDDASRSSVEPKYLVSNDGNEKIVTGVPGDRLMFLGGSEKKNKDIFSVLRIIHKKHATVSSNGGHHDPLGNIDAIGAIPKLITETIMRAIGNSIKGNVSSSIDNTTVFSEVYSYKSEEIDYIHPYSTPVYLGLHKKIQDSHNNNIGLLYTVYPRGNSTLGKYESKLPLSSDEVCKTASEFLQRVANTTRNNIYLLLYINKEKKKENKESECINEYSIPNSASGEFKHPDVSNEDVAVAHIIGIYLGEQMYYDKHKSDLYFSHTILNVRCQHQGDKTEFKKGLTEFIKSIKNPLKFNIDYMETLNI